jgi:environmental stress-induced protein Ves
VLRILTTDDFRASPWKNGGGVTHEIARHPVDGDWQWRLSIAEVASDGPFSRFDGLSRILTVIDGDGVDLHSADGIMQARLGEPVHFSGDLAVTSRLVNGPIRDLNVIYNARVVDASVTLLAAPGELTLGPHRGGCLALAGPVIIDGSSLPVGAFALGTTGQITVGPGARALLVELRDVPAMQRWSKSAIDRRPSN